ncbi:MAG: DUF3179 domain-containing protein [Chloroflexi bacterium]|nr:DUF3179 domain-containing protein [Chloroflexota bacterium]
MWVAVGWLVACTAPGVTSTPSPTREKAADLVRDEPTFATSDWKTDFSRHSAPYSEIMSGGPPKDGIPAIDRPEFVSVAMSESWLENREPVVFYEFNGDARAYPVQILIWHEIVNDVVGGKLVVITFCPLCHTAIAFERELEGRLYDFGTTGKLRFSDLVMYDRQTESWWQQATGEAIVGQLTGKRLTFLPASLISWAEFKAAHPRGQVLSKNTGHSRSYGRNPYVGYDDIDQPPFLYQGPADGRLKPMERVVTVALGREAVAYPYSVLEKEKVIHDEVGGRGLVVLFKKGTASALDTEAIPQGRDVGATGVFDRVVDGRSLTFRWDGATFRDKETNTSWNLLGQGIEGPLQGKRLEPIIHGDHFWFAWAVFQLQTRVFSP